MCRRCIGRAPVLMLCALALLCLDPLRVHSAEPVDYTAQIKPILVKKCVSCHGALRQHGGLRVDAIQLLRAGGDSGAALDPGQVDKSVLWSALKGDGYTRMPKDADALPADELALFEAWIAQGAKGPEEEPVANDPRKHWSFQAPVRHELPTVKNSAWVRNPIDAFIAAGHETHGVTPLAETEKHVLLRRVSLDLVGLPPTVEQLEAFLADDSDGAYERAVDRLLESPAYGERWGRHWMDVWRYSDWSGYAKELRDSGRHVWRWRDWIVESLNADKPYDRMIVEMLAADEVAPEDSDALRATGFLVRNYYKFNRDKWLDRTIEHTSKGFLGITLNCARCHDHMYDPISQRDYYRFRALFEPHDVRTDRIPGQADVMADGVTRVFDAHAERQTFLYERGNDKAPAKDDPLEPGVPDALSPVALHVEQVSLPVAAHYAGLRSFIVEEALRKARVELAESRSDLAAADVAIGSAKKRAQATAANSGGTSAQDEKVSAKALAEHAIAVKRLASAEAQSRAVDAVIAADRARFADPPSADKDAFALAAAQAQREASLLAAEYKVAEQERILLSAIANPSKDEAKQKKSVETAEKWLADAKAALDNLKQEQAAAATTAYEPFDKVYPASSTGRRAALARWIADEQNPLTARVAVNHLWMRHFGRPLVSTVFDFGLHGKPPSHPELLDWLAVEFMSNGWRMKPIHRLIVTSNAYRMASDGPGVAENAAKDPDNVWLWRANPRRMESELVRDGLLAVTGTLDRTVGGPDLDAEAGLTTFRRSLYYRHAPEKSMTFLTLFDAASTDECYRRAETIVPQQALALANSRLCREQSRTLAKQLLDSHPDSADATVRRALIEDAFARILSRAPTDDETTACSTFLDEQAARLTTPASLTAVAGSPETSVGASSDPRVRAVESLVHVLFNHNDFVTIR